MTETIGSKLSALRHRAGVTLTQVAKAAGYAGPSSVQAYFSADYNTPLRPAIGIALAAALEGRGEPPITVEDIFPLIDAFTGAEMKHLRDVKELQERIRRSEERSPSPTSEILDPPTLRGQPRDVPVYGSALAADLVFDANGKGPEPVEITNFAMGDIITYVRRPPGLDGRNKVYAIFVSGSSMEPRYRPGDPVFVDPQRPPAIGDDVIVQLQAGDESGDIVSGLIKTLVKRTASHLELEQYEPAIRFQVPAERIAHIHRVIPWRECFGM